MTAAPIRRRRRRWPVVLVVLLIVVALLVVAAVVGDRVFRTQAEAQIEKTVEANLPKGVHGRVTARIDGFSALQQWAAGSFEQVELRSSGLQIAGAPASADVQLYGLPVSGGTVTSATGVLTVGQAAFHGLPALQKVHASDPVLGRGTVSTTLTQSILGLQVKVGVTLAPSLSNQVVHLVPTSATLTAGPATVPATAIVRQLLPDGVSVCAAQYLPRGVAVDQIAALPGEARVVLSAQDVDLEQLGTSRTGSCD